MTALILIIVMLLLCSAFFSASETALFSLSQVQLHQLKQTRRRRGQSIFTALKKPRPLLITILLGNELVNVAIAITGAALIARTLAVGTITETLIAIAIVTPLVLIFGEIVPKNIALRYARQYAQFAIVPLSLFSSVVRPLRAVLTWIADIVIRLFGGQASEEPTIREREYRKLVDLGRREGVLIEEEREIIHSIFEFSDKVVSSIMTPAESLFALPVDLTYEDVLGKLKLKRLSRIPFYEGTRDNIVGIFHLRDLFVFDHKWRLGGEQSLRSLMHTPLFVDPDMKLEELLGEFQQKRIHMAIVRRDDGPVLGLVTMDDVLEDLFGEMEVS